MLRSCSNVQTSVLFRGPQSVLHLRWSRSARVESKQIGDSGFRITMMSRVILQFLRFPTYSVPPFNHQPVVCVCVKEEGPERLNRLDLNRNVKCSRIQRNRVKRPLIITEAPLHTHKVPADSVFSSSSSLPICRFSTFPVSGFQYKLPDNVSLSKKKKSTASRNRQDAGVCCRVAACRHELATALLSRILSTRPAGH